MAVMLACEAQNAMSQSGASQADKPPNQAPQALAPTQNGPYVVEGEPKRCSGGNLCPPITNDKRATAPTGDGVSGASKAEQNNHPAALAAAPSGVGGDSKPGESELLGYKPVPVPFSKPKDQLKPPIEPKWGEAAVPSIKDASVPESPPLPNPYNLKDGKLNLPLRAGSGPISAVAVVATGAFIGLLGSIWILKLRFSHELYTRPNGDLARAHLFTKNLPYQSWNTSGYDKADFQLQNALRKKLITNEEFRELRTKYLIGGNFSFSMLLPILLALVLITANASEWFEKTLISVVGAVTTTLLTTYAVDRRHQFRAEYRTLILQNLIEHAQLRDQTKPTDGESSWIERLGKIGNLLMKFAATYRPGSANSSTEESSEEGEEQ